MLWEVQPGWEFQYRPEGIMSSWQWQVELEHRFRIRWIPDSLVEINEDHWHLQAQLDKSFGQQKFFWSQQGRIESKAIPAAWSAHIQGQSAKEFPSPYAMNPGIFSFDSGIRWEAPPMWDLRLGLSGGKLSWISDGSLWTQFPDETQVFGIERPRHWRLDYGCSAQIQWLWEPRPSWRIELRSRAFYGFNEGAQWSLESEKNLQWNPWHRLAFAWVSRWLYQPLVYQHHQWMMEWRLGYILGSKGSSP